MWKRQRYNAAEPEKKKKLSWMHAYMRAISTKVVCIDTCHHISGRKGGHTALRAGDDVVDGEEAEDTDEEEEEEEVEEERPRCRRRSSSAAC